jgi:predicted RNA polymerase sigma factor
MTRRISRAKQAIRDGGVPFRLPPPTERIGRLGAVLHVLYLTFNEGYASTSGPALQRPAMTAEAIRLTRTMRRLLPEDSEVAGLLALMLLTDARRAARIGPDGELMPMAEQDRTKWDAGQIREGIDLITAALPVGATGPYQLQAAIAALHDEAPSVEATDWPQIVALYEVLMQISDNPLVALNHAVAVAMVDGAPAGLELLAKAGEDERIADDRRVHAVRAHLLEMLGDCEAARVSYEQAARRATSWQQQRYLYRQASRLSES